MTTKTQSSSTQKISTYLMFIVLIVLALSVVSIILAATAYLSAPSDVITPAFFALVGIIAMAMSIFTLFQSRRQAKEMKIEAPKVMTTVGCTNKTCDSKTLREFQRGDYVFKELDTPCPKCGGKQMVTAIYKEVKEKEKNYNV